MAICFYINLTQNTQFANNFLHDSTNIFKSVSYNLSWNNLAYTAMLIVLKNLRQLKQQGKKWQMLQ